jgi:hypothetical protein
MLELFCTQQHSVEVSVQLLPEIKIHQQSTVNRSSEIFSCCAPWSYSETTSAPSESLYTVTVHRKVQSIQRKAGGLEDVGPTDSAIQGVLGR